MNISKLEALLKEDRWFEYYLASQRHLYAYQRNNEKAVKDFRDYVRRNINFVAFRPWESLRLLDQATRVTSKLGEKGHQLHRVVEYEVLWHSNETGKFYGRQSFANGIDKPTVGQLIAAIIRHRVEYPCSEKRIYVDAVVKHSYTHSTLVGDYTGESFEIYLCPEDWMLDWMKKDDYILRTLRAKGIWVQGLTKAA